MAQLEEALASLKGEVAALVGQGDVEGGGDAEHAQHSVLSSDTRYQLTRYIHFCVEILVINFLCNPVKAHGEQRGARCTRMDLCGDSGS